MNTRKRIWIPEAPLINLRRYVEVEALRATATIAGHFDVELIHARTGLVKQKLSFPNVITDVGLDQLWGGSNNISSYFSHLAVGTGSSNPDVGDTALDAEIGRTSSNGGFADEDSDDGATSSQRHWRACTRTRVFGNNEANGNLTELGFFTASSGGVLMNRQLFRDELGAPTTITKTSDDQLRIRYTWRVYSPLDDVFDTINIGGTPHDITVRAMYVDTNNIVGWHQRGFANWSTATASAQVENRSTMFARDDGTVSTNRTADSGTLHSYSSGSFYRDRTLIWNPASVNYAQGVRWMSCGFAGGNARIFQFLIQPGIPKSDTERLIVMQRMTIDRHPVT